MQIRDRVKELRRVPSSELRPNPRNWRTHPQAQADALRGMLAEVGFAGAALARELADGTLELIDGHLRAETAPGAVIPVLVLDVTEDEANKLLATYDPLGAMAGTDAAMLDSLLSEVGAIPPALESLLMVESEAARTSLLAPLPPTGAADSSNGSRWTNDPAAIVKVVLPCPDVALFERAMSATGEANRGVALKTICEAYLATTR